jgi:hypothetical protein
MFIVSINIAFYLEQRIWSDMYMPSSMEHLTQWHVLVAISIPYQMWFKGFIYFLVITDDAVGEHGCRTWESTCFVLLRWLQKNDIHMLQFQFLLVMDLVLANLSRGMQTSERIVIWFVLHMYVTLQTGFVPYLHLKLKYIYMHLVVLGHLLDWIHGCNRTRLLSSRKDSWSWIKPAQESVEQQDPLNLAVIGSWARTIPA